MAIPLTTWEVVLQSQAIHPDWDAKAHIEFLEWEGVDLSKLVGGSPIEIVTRWLAENVANGRLAELIQRSERIQQKGLGR